MRRSTTPWGWSTPTAWPACAAASSSGYSPTRRSSSTRAPTASPVAVKGWLYGNRHQFFIQLLAALTIIIYDALMTFIILRVISIFTPLRMPDDELEVGDLAVHDEEAYPADEGYTRVDAVGGGVLVGSRTRLGASASTGHLQRRGR